MKPLAIIIPAALLVLLVACAQDGATGNVALNGSYDDSADAANDSGADSTGSSVDGPPPASQNVSNAGAMEAGPLAVTSEVIDYGPARGFLAQPAPAGEYPGVVLIHEWWGLNEGVQQAAATLASHGYRVLAVDLYNGTVAATPDEARQLVGTVNDNVTVANMQAAADYLRQNGSERIASFGWCFGGRQSLQLALSGEELDATVIYYGQLETDPQRLGAIEWPVLGVFGAEDESIPVSQVQAFNESLQTAGVTRDIHIYDGVGHAFANPSGENYAPAQTADAWSKTLAFLNATLRQD